MNFLSVSIDFFAEYRQVGKLVPNLLVIYLRISYFKEVIDLHVRSDVSFSYVQQDLEGFDKKDKYLLLKIK